MAHICETRPTPLQAAGPRYQPLLTIAAPELGLSYLVQATLHLATDEQLHRHDDVQVLLTLEGTFEVIFETGVRHRLEPGGVSVIPAGLPHRTSRSRVPRDVTLLDVRLPVSPPNPLVRFLLRDARPRHASVDPSLLGEAAARLRQAAQDPGRQRLARLMSELWEIFSHVAADREQQALARITDRVERRIRLAEQFMEDHLAEPIGVGDVAAAVNLSRSQLTRLYAAHIGSSPAQRLREVRIDLARRLLVGSALSIKEIARVCGFASADHFSRVFRDVTGVTATAARRKGATRDRQPSGRHRRPTL